MASYVGSGITISSRSDLSSYTTGTNGGSNYTVGSGSDRLLLIWLIGFTNAASDTKGASAVTHNGQSATNYGALPNNDRTWVELWYIKNPTTGSGGTSVTCVSGQRAFITFAEEFDGVDQTTPIHATFDSYGANSNTHTFTLSPSAGSILSAAVSVRASAGTFSASDGGTLIQSDVTGTLSFNDVSGGLAYENVASSGSNSLTISWTTSNNNSGLMVEVLAAAGGDTNVSASSASLRVTGQQASVANDVGVSAGASALQITTNAATISTAANVDVGASAAALQLSPSAASIAVDVGVSAAAANMQVTGQAASVSLDVAVTASPASLQVTTNAATISAPVDVTVNASPATLAISGGQASIAFDVNIPASVANLQFSPYTATVSDGGLSARRTASPGGSATGGTFTRSGKGGTVARTFNSGTII